MPPERLVVVRCAERDLRGRVTAALLEGLPAVYAEVPAGADEALLRRLGALARAAAPPSSSAPCAATSLRAWPTSTWWARRCAGRAPARGTGGSPGGGSPCAPPGGGRAASNSSSRWSMTARTLCVWFPDWRLRRPDAPPDAPCQVVGDGVVLAANALAAAAGVAAGMRRRQAETLCPAVVTLAADPGAEAAAFEAVAAAVEDLVPRVEVAAPGLLFVPVAGAVGYYGGEGPLVARVAEAVEEAGGPGGRLGLADGPFAARLAAAAAADGPVIVADTRAFLAGLDVAVLGMEEMAATLRWLGITTLGALGALPREAVASRFGPPGLEAHRLAGGEDRWG